MNKNNSLKRPVLYEWLLFGVLMLLSLLLVAFIIYCFAVLNNSQNSGSNSLGEAVVTIVLAVLLVLGVIALAPTLISTGISLGTAVGLTKKHKNGQPEKQFILKAVLKIVCAVVLGLFFGYIAVQLLIEGTVLIGIIAAVVTLSVLVMYAVTTVGCFTRRAAARRQPVQENDGSEG